MQRGQGETRRQGLAPEGAAGSARHLGLSLRSATRSSGGAALMGCGGVMSHNNTPQRALSPDNATCKPRSLRFLLVPKSTCPVNALVSGFVLYRSDNGPVARRV